MECFQEGHEDTHDVARQVCSSTTYLIMLIEFAELPMELYTLKLTVSFQQRLSSLPSSWLASQALTFSSPCQTSSKHLA